MTTLYRSFNDHDAEWTSDIAFVINWELPCRTGEQLIEIINDYRGVNDARSLYALSDIDALFKHNTALEVLKACQYIDLDAPYFEYDGTDVTSIDNVYDYLKTDEFADIVNWLVDDDRWEWYEELASVIETKEVDEEE